MSEHDELANLADMSEIDEQIIARAGEEDLLDKMQEQKDKKTAERSPLFRELRNHWFSYTLLFLSFLLTEMTAFYLGTSPTMETNPDGGRYINFNTDVGHFLTTLIYMLVFPAVTEIAFAVFRNKFNERETGNIPQQLWMGIAAGVALVSIVGTGVSGTFVIFSTLGSVGFVEVPPSVQTWLIWVMPILLALYGLCYWVYESNSDEEKARRLGEEQDRKAEIADQLRMREIERAGKRAIRAEAIRAYQKAVARGLLSHQEATEGLAQGISLAELEKKLRRDLTGEGKIGDTSGLNSPASPVPPRSAPNPSTYKAYTLTELLAFWNMTKEEAVEMLNNARLYTSNDAFYALHRGGYIPSDFGTDALAVDRFRGLFSELVGIVSLPVPPLQVNQNNGATAGKPF